MINQEKRDRRDMIGLAEINIIQVFPPRPLDSKTDKEHQFSST